MPRIFHRLLANALAAVVVGSAVGTLAFLATWLLLRSDDGRQTALALDMTAFVGFMLIGSVVFALIFIPRVFSSGRKAEPTSYGPVSGPAAPAGGAGAKRKTSSWLSTAAVLIGAAIAGSIANQVGKEIGNKASRARSSPAVGPQTLEQMAAGVNRLAPRWIDDRTRFERAIAGPGAKFTYVYSFPNDRLPTETRTSQLLLLRSELEPELNRKLCSAPDLALLRRLAQQIVYRYQDADGQLVTEITVEPARCSTKG
jgi:hypothetical protein